MSECRTCRRVTLSVLFISNESGTHARRLFICGKYSTLSMLVGGCLTPTPHLFLSQPPTFNTLYCADWLCLSVTIWVFLDHQFLHLFYTHAHTHIHTHFLTLPHCVSPKSAHNLQPSSTPPTLVSSVCVFIF